MSLLWNSVLCSLILILCLARLFSFAYDFLFTKQVISVDVLYNYLESFAKVPWPDLRYIFGEIMYGGHISDDWDRRLCSSYLEVYMREDMLEGAFELAYVWW